MEMTLPVSVSALFAREKKELQDPNYMLILPLEGEIRLQGEQTRLPNPARWSSWRRFRGISCS